MPSHSFAVGGGASPNNLLSPLQRFLFDCHAGLRGDNGGAVADYIPELGKANPHHFGVSLATIDGHVYEVGDTAVPFTIQSISKPFVFALALQALGADKVEAIIGVEPSGDAFNSIRLRPDNRPYNPMVNSGAIACSALIHKARGSEAFECIRDALSRFAGRELFVDEAVFASERETGDRNRAIAYLLRNYSVVEGDVDAVLDVYFRQCSVLVTARDLAVMAAALANNGVNPLSGEQVMKPYVVARTLSIMTTSGMYDYAGEWVYRVGMPAKSGVGGGIVAALPAQIGLGTFSPLLDEHGNSVRGLKICEALSTHFGLHMLNRTADVRTSIIADYDIGGGIRSRRSRLPRDQQILNRHHKDVRIIELVGAHSFATMDYVSRRLTKNIVPFLILDFRRVASITTAGGLLLAELLRGLKAEKTTVILSGLAAKSEAWAVINPLIGNISDVQLFSLLDQAIEWAEDQLISRHGGGQSQFGSHLNEQAMLEGLTENELTRVARLGIERSYRAGQCIVTADEPATSLFFLQSGIVSVKLPSGVRLATLDQGMEFGEMALLDERRTADVWADTDVTCLELPIERLNRCCREHPHIGEHIARNLAAILAKRLILANAKIDLLSA
ncbi:MAG TPA: glutaminase A [Xanthobacteraceae bacterium]|jgi:glutaminase|nr:glutaminase A [Xanthobacteraceae bacterium]